MGAAVTFVGVGVLAEISPGVERARPFEDVRRVNIVDQKRLFDVLREKVSSDEGFALATLNLDHLVKLKDRDFRAAYDAHEIVTADGFPIVWARKLARLGVRRTTGADLVVPLARFAAEQGLPVAVVGAAPDALEGGVARLKELNPGLEVAFAHSPPLGFDPRSPAADEVLAQVKASGARICIVALGAPKQEIFAARGRTLAPRCGFVSVGAGIDFLTSRQRRAPSILQRLHLEWAWRASSDPRRLLPRYLKCAALLPGLMGGAVAERFRPLTGASAFVDFSRLSANTTGIERISLELFSARYLGVEALQEVRARGVLGMILAQWLTLPLKALANPRSLVFCPGFPPSIALSLLGGRRVVPYVHDLFLLKRPEDLNVRAKVYMRPSFAFALRHLRTFLVNSQYTADALRPEIRKDAEIVMLRPAVRNVFGLSPEARTEPRPEGPLRLISLGTIEPRKNYLAAARVRRALAERLGEDVELHVIGRDGWGEDAALLRGEAGVILHGYVSEAEARRLLEQADVFLSTSKDEGLGLPLLEVQHGGLPVAASDIPPFREVLGPGGCFIDPAEPAAAAAAIASLIGAPDWRRREAAKALTNVARWNAIAEADRRGFQDWVRRGAGVNVAQAVPRPAEA